jgi:hypothetical protein
MFRPPSFLRSFGLALPLVLVVACGDDQAAEGGGTGGGSSSSGSTSSGEGGSCELPASAMPSGTLTDPSGQAVEAIAGAVIASSGLELVVDTCFAPDADCFSTPYTLTMSGGLQPSVPVGTLVEVTVAPADPFRDADETATVRVTNQPQLEGFANPTMSQMTDWFVSTTAYTCEHPGLIVKPFAVCDGLAVDTYSIALERRPQSDVLDDGEVVTNGYNGVLYTVAFLGGWTEGPGEIGSCRWQVARGETILQE